jgi:hypothetical protein
MEAVGRVDAVFHFGPEGTSVDIKGSASVRDSDGNFVDVSTTVKDNGEQVDVAIGGGRDSSKDEDPKE